MIVGIDLGGTKTHVRAESDDNVLLDLSVPTKDWLQGTLLAHDSNAERLLGLFAHLDGADAAPLAIGAHDLDSRHQIDQFSALLTAARVGPVIAVNDVELVALAAGLDEAVSVIVGTGSKVVGHSASGHVVAAGGHGYLLDDPGSAPSLAREAVRAVTDADDEGKEPDRLALRLMEHFGVDDVAVMAAEFTANASLAAWARLGPLVFNSADQGSAIAAQIIDEAACILARDVARVHARGAVGVDVVCAGGVITNQPRLYRALTRHIEALNLGLAVSLLADPPVIGAVALARRLVTQGSTRQRNTTQGNTTHSTEFENQSTMSGFGGTHEVK
ncbi:N-acetylglucosamine kinase [Rathayibacter soli]|uniref:N-acetylglucosamine kinase n=1 Tax=Rathayibacter soli TaxID=3144168 RepID=UPI0027E4586C|nr:BadF/BadG/BcrA/BcrD ATPase family protein [Glaciibacter superstes]